MVKSEGFTIYTECKVMDQIKKFYDLAAEETAEKWYPNEILMPTIRDFLSNFKLKPRILDLGCGTGHESMRLHSLGAEVVGVDFSSESLKIARKRNPECTFILKDYFELDKSIGLFDGIFSSGSIIHISYEKLPKLFEILFHIVKNNGFLELIIQKGEGQRIREHIIKNEKIERIIYFFTLQQLKPILRQFSFDFYRKGYLDTKLKEMNWRCYIFQKINDPV
ncbi:MAG: class I SAM-dependent methyltransferase [Promethearchaeota archaeon]